MATAISVLDNLIRDELPSVIIESLPEIAPTYKYIESTSVGVGRDEIGRQWRVNHLFGCGVAGLIQNANPLGIAFRTNTNFPMVDMINGSDSSLTPFPTAADAPHTSTIKRVLSLHKNTGNFSIPVAWLQADALSASQIEQVTRDIKAVGELRALTEAISFFMSSNNTLCQVDNWSTSTSLGQFTIASGTGSIQFFRPGMMIDFVANNAGSPNWSSILNYVSTTYIPMLVYKVDYVSGTIYVCAPGGTTITDFTTDVADDCWVALRGCTTSGREMKTWGLEDWIKSSGTILQRESISGEGINLTTYPQFKSVLAAVGGALTDTVLNRYLGGFLNAYQGTTLDTILTTLGVTMKYLEQPDTTSYFYDRTGKPLNVHGGFVDVNYSFRGQQFRWLISPMVLSGTLYGLRFNGGNIKRYTPPKIGGTNTTVGAEVEFLAPLAGNSSVFMLGRASTGAVQELLEAPFYQYLLVAPVDVRAVKLTTLTETTLG